MSVGGRVLQLLDSHGHSYAQAEKVTDVSRETIRRICLGHNPPKVRYYLRKIAQGYGIDELSLLEGASPKGEFEWYIRQASPAQRLEWVVMSPAQRVRLTLSFLRSSYANAVPMAALAAACGRNEAEIALVWERWGACPPDTKTALVLARAISSLTGISLAWFFRGRLEMTWSAPAQRLPRVSVYVRMSQEASAADGISALARMVVAS